MSDLNLWQRLAKIYQQVEAIPKTGYNKDHNYKFIEHSHIAGVLRSLLGEHGVILKTELLEHEVKEFTSKNGSRGENWLVKMRFTFVNADKPEERDSTDWIGQAADYGDKGFNKATTSAQKYFLVRTFLISDADPDAEAPEMPKPAPKQANPPQKPPVQKPNPPVNKATGEIIAPISIMTDEDLAAWENDIAEAFDLDALSVVGAALAALQLPEGDIGNVKLRKAYAERRAKLRTNQ